MSSNLNPPDSETLVTDLVALTPLIKSVGWLAIVVWLIIKYGKHIDELILVAKGRVQTGSGVKLGPIELGEQVGTQSIESQKAEADADVRSLRKSMENDFHDHTGDIEDVFRDDEPQLGLDEVYIAEELVLRALQSEIGRPILRKIQLNNGLQADGFYRVGKKHTVVEVKSVTPDNVVTLVGMTVASLEEHLGSLSLETTDILLCLAFFDSLPAEDVSVEITRLISRTALPIKVRHYDIDELRYRFGLHT